MGRLHLTSQHFWQGSVKRMERGNTLSVLVCVHGNSGYKQVVYPPQASCGNLQPESLADDNKMSKGQIRLQGTVMCTAQFSTEQYHIQEE